MNVRELRIGNWLRWKSEHSYLFQITNIDVEDIIILEEMEAIQLLPEILEASGFEKHYNNYIKDNFVIEEQPDGTLNFSMWENIEKAVIDNDTIIIKKNIKHVHELQNLVFAITDVELNVQIPINQQLN